VSGPEEVFRWEEPPVTRGREPRDWTAVLGRLKDRPGEWARVAETDTANNAAATAYSIRHGNYSGIRPNQYDAVSRSVEGRFCVYARWVGETS
jgi:hypothetical protein